MQKKTHEQFLIDLWNTNKHYREGNISIISNYEGNKKRITVSDRYGVSYCIPSNLLKGHIPDISSAEDKTKYFINMCIDKFGIGGNDDFSEFEYINTRVKSKFIDRQHGAYFISPAAYIAGKRSRLKKNFNIGKILRFKDDYVFKRIEEINPEIKVLPNQVYKSIAKHILVKDKYGVCRVKPTHLLFGHKPTIKTAINKTEYFINQAKDVHGDKYDYSLVEYKGCGTKVKIISANGVFYQTPGNHLSGSGCPIEAANIRKVSSPGWVHSVWQQKSTLSKNFSGFKVYFLECWDDNTGERFYKIGRTFTKIEDRFSGKKHMPYSYKILHCIELYDAKVICQLEQDYKNKHKEFKYLPKIKFGGMHECFSRINIDATICVNKCELLSKKDKEQ